MKVGGYVLVESFVSLCDLVDVRHISHFLCYTGQTVQTMKNEHASTSLDSLACITKKM